MASASASSSNGVSGRIRNASLVLVSDNHRLKTLKILWLSCWIYMVILWLSCWIYMVIVIIVHQQFNLFANVYRPEEQLTDFQKLLDDEFTKLKGTTSSVPQNDNLMRQFREAVWNVHHAGEPMPGDDEEDIVMTSTQCPLLNMTCPLSGKPVSELADPVRSMDCRHVHEKAVILHYIVNNPNAKCPVAGCRGKLQNNKVIWDPMLTFEIEEMRSLNKQSNRAKVIEDFTEEVDED